MIMTEAQKQLRLAHIIVTCPECGRGEFMNTYPSAHDHKPDCRVAKYLAIKELWDYYAK